jgi:hypothetical protein
MATRTFSRKASATTRTSAVLLSFIAISCLAGSALLGAGMMRGPGRLTLDCERASARCTTSPRWPWLGPSTFAMTQLGELEVWRTTHHAALAVVVDGRPNYWTEETSDAAEIAELEAGVEAIHAFEAGSAPTLHLSLPRGRPFSPFVLLFVVAFGLYLARGLGSYVMQTDVEVDDEKREVRVVLHHWWRPNTRRTMPIASIRGVRRIHTRSARYRWIAVVLVLEGGELRIVREFLTPAVEAETGTLAHGLAEAIGVPLSP